MGMKTHALPMPATRASWSRRAWATVLVALAAAAVIVIAARATDRPGTTVVTRPVHVSAMEARANARADRMAHLRLGYLGGPKPVETGSIASIDVIAPAPRGAFAHRR
jgi:hypothetical protein